MPYPKFDRETDPRFWKTCTDCFNDQLALSAYNIGPGSDYDEGKQLTPPECRLFIGFAETYHKNQAHVLVPRWWLGEYVVAVIGPWKSSWKDQFQCMKITRTLQIQ